MASHHLPFVLFQVKTGLYGVGSENVREIVLLPKVSVVPDLPPEIRGVINLRGKGHALGGSPAKTGFALRQS